MCSAIHLTLIDLKGINIKKCERNDTIGRRKEGRVWIEMLGDGRLSHCSFRHVCIISCVFFILFFYLLFVRVAERVWQNKRDGTIRTPSPPSNQRHIVFSFSPFYFFIGFSLCLVIHTGYYEVALGYYYDYNSQIGLFCFFFKYLILWNKWGPICSEGSINCV